MGGLRRVAVAFVLVLVTGTGATTGAHAAGSGAARMFATNNTEIITDPDDPRLDTRLVRFAHRVRQTVGDGGAVAGRSALLDGVFWSAELRRATYERSRAFDLHRVDAIELHHIADLVRKEFDQESVLTFEYLPESAPGADAVEVEVPGVDVTELHDGLAANPRARERLGGGSVTIGGRLILVAERADLDLVREFVAELGADWDSGTMRYGDREFVG